MKKSRLLSVLLCLALLSGLLATFASAADSGSAILDEMDVNAKAAVLVDPDTGEILYEKNAHAHNYPASITKVMTCLLTLEAVDRGVDFFDCVYPSRNGRHGHVYTNQGKRNLFNSRYELDHSPIEEGCGCPACRSYSRAYIRHLLKAKEMLGMRLCVLHNLYFYNTMMEEIRDAIEEHRYAEYKERKLSGMAAGETK